MAKFLTRNEAIERQIVMPIEGTGVVINARAEYDIDAIAGEVLGGYEVGYVSTQDVDAFWRAVEKHEKRGYVHTPAA